MITKIFWDETRGTVYWMNGEEVWFAPMNDDDTADLDNGSPVEFWIGNSEVEVAQEEARVRGALK